MCCHDAPFTCEQESSYSAGVARPCAGDACGKPGNHLAAAAWTGDGVDRERRTLLLRNGRVSLPDRQNSVTRPTVP